jgi:hypothetical protein
MLVPDQFFDDFFDLVIVNGSPAASTWMRSGLTTAFSIFRITVERRKVAANASLPNGLVGGAFCLIFLFL